MTEIPLKDDRKYYHEQLSRLPTRELQRKAADGYRAVFLEYFHAELILHKKENKARYAANTRLRVFVDKIISSCKNVSS